MESDNTPEKDQKKFENELSRLKLSAEYGAKFFQGDQGELPPDLEAQWLDNIQSFEEQFTKGEVRKIRLLLDNPVLLAPDEVLDENLPGEIERILDMMEQNDISLEALYDVPDQVFYRFIYEELMDYEIQVVNVTGMVTCLTYEDFHPNDKEDLNRYSGEFLEYLESKDFEFMEGITSTDVRFHGEIVKSKEFIDKVSFLLENKVLKIRKNKTVNIEYDEEKAEVKCHLSFEITTNTGEVSHYDEEATFSFKHELGYWYISAVSILGLGL